MSNVTYQFNEQKKCLEIFYSIGKMFFIFSKDIFTKNSSLGGIRFEGVGYNDEINSKHNELNFRGGIDFDFSKYHIHISVGSIHHLNTMYSGNLEEAIKTACEWVYETFKDNYVPENSDIELYERAFCGYNIKDDSGHYIKYLEL